MLPGFGGFARLTPTPLCSYFQQLVDTEVEAAKARGTFNKGVVFLEKGVEERSSDIIWRHPRANQGEVRSATTCARTARARLSLLAL